MASVALMWCPPRCCCCWLSSASPCLHVTNSNHRVFLSAFVSVTSLFSSHFVAFSFQPISVVETSVSCNDVLLLPSAFPSCARNLEWCVFHCLFLLVLCQFCPVLFFLYSAIAVSYYAIAKCDTFEPYTFFLRNSLLSFCFFLFLFSAQLVFRSQTCHIFHLTRAISFTECVSVCTAQRCDPRCNHR